MNRITIIEPDGSERPLDHLPDLKEMQQIVGGSIELVRVLRADLEGFVYTTMVVNETGLLDGLARNQKATDIYLANVRRAYPDHPNPTQQARADWRARFPGAVFIDATPADHDPDSPYIAGTVIHFAGWTTTELEEAGF